MSPLNNLELDVHNLVCAVQYYQTSHVTTAVLCLSLLDYKYTVVLPNTKGPLYDKPLHDHTTARWDVFTQTIYVTEVLWSLANAARVAVRSSLPSSELWSYFMPLIIWHSLIPLVSNSTSCIKSHYLNLKCYWINNKH